MPDTAATTAATTTTDTAKTSALDIDALTTAFLARFPALPATATRLGNTSSGTTEETPVWGKTKTFPDGAPLRLAVPMIADRVGLEYSPDRKTVLIRVHSPWNEGGWHDTYFTPDGKIVGGMFDIPFPRQDAENKTAENRWQFGTGFWEEYEAWGKQTTDAYRNGLPFTELKPGADSGVPGYSWKSDEGGLVITTPKTTIYGLVPIEAAVTDPANANLCFSLYNAFTLNWSGKGSGKELKSFAPSFDWQRYPTDPRRTPADKTHPGPIGAVRLGSDLYILSGANEVMVHRWDAVAKVLVPVAALYVRPDELPSSIPGHPVIDWGQGAICRADNTGNFTADRWQTFDAKALIPLWNGYRHDVDGDGNLYFLPRWEQLQDAGDGAVWRTFDLVRGVFSPDNLTTLILPDALKTAAQCEQIRIDWESGDMVAVVNRGQGWSLERYPAWQNSASPAGIKAAYMSAPIALTVRRQYLNTSKWNARWGCSPDPAIGIPTAGFGTMAICGGYVFIAEAQAEGVRIHRLWDGSIVGRVADRLHTNATIDDPAQIQVTESPTEFRVFLMDFHGKSVLVWRILKKDLEKAGK